VPALAGLTCLVSFCSIPPRCRRRHQPPRNSGRREHGCLLIPLYAAIATMTSVPQVPVAFASVLDQLASTDRPRCNRGSYLGPTETMILMSELPRIPFNMPDTWIVKKSCPTKSELAVYENPGPSNFTWPAAEEK
jgi:hypothetical protein